MAAVLVDPHFDDTEKSTIALSPQTDALLDHLPLFVSQMKVVAAADVADPAMLVRRHGPILNHGSPLAYLRTGTWSRVQSRRRPHRVSP